MLNRRGGAQVRVGHHQKTISVVEPNVSARVFHTPSVSCLGLSTPRGAPEPGQIVHVRGRPFVVVEAEGSRLPEATIANQHLVRLSSVEDDALGEELEVIWELEPGRLA